MSKHVLEPAMWGYKIVYYVVHTCLDYPYKLMFALGIATGVGACYMVKWLVPAVLP